MNTADHLETWLFDLGNSRLKGARLSNGAPNTIFGLAWDEAGFDDALRTCLSEWPQPARVLVASVTADVRAKRLRDVLHRWPGLRVEWLHSPRRGCGIVNSYARPERFGIDRFLALVAVRARTRRGAVVAGCGTALTLDAIDADGAHREGLISASPALMLAGLHGATAIGDFNPGAFEAHGNDDTERALHAGCWGAAGALVEWFVAEQRTTTGQELWLHGGWAAPLATWLERDGCRVRIVEHAVLEGLALWAGTHSAAADVP